MTGMFFNAAEILEMAEQIERNGAEFYRKAALAVEDPSGKKVLEDLAEWELGHEKIFFKMKQELSEMEQGKNTFDPNEEASLYIRAFSDGHVFDLTEDPTKFLGDNPGLRKILLKAIDREKDAIVFFTGFLNLVPSFFGKEKVDMILKEEFSHIGQLGEKLSELES